ncbi:hypothetical protein BDP67DRAFT_545294 [Colletotrichum lupini]|nr:hypothetical protein BDP67DRAFT_545294 [Colletotrichum lupini]
MNASFGLVSSRSFLHLGLRAACRSAPSTTSCSPASRLLSICTITSWQTPAATRTYISGPSPLRRRQWPSLSLAATTAGKSTQRWASSSSASSSSPPKTDYKNEPLLREYVDLPLDYKDKHGLRFREENKDLSAAEVRAVFGASLKPAAANRLLRIMHGRRVAGTLEDPAFAINTAAFTAQQRDAALAYLREKTPVDEVLNAGLRAEDELAALEKDLAEEESSADEGDAASSTAGSKTPSLRKETPVVKPDPVYGYSAFDAIRAKNQAKAAEEEARLIAEAEAKGIDASTATVGALIALNVLVSVAWRVPPLWRFLNRYFVLVHGMPRAVTMITANFSHSSLGHLATNMVGLWFMGTALHDEVGRANFLAIYLASGAVGFLGSLTAFTLRGLLTVSTVGASGAVFGVATAYFWMHRFDSFKVLGFPPDPMNGPQGLGFIALILGFHIYAFFRRGKQTIDLTSHLFGMLAGLVGIEFVTGRKAEGARADGLDKKKARGDLVADAPPRDGQGDGGNDVEA